MLRVKHLLVAKGHEIWTVEAEDPVLEAIQVMADREVGALPVMRGDELVGIGSERDYARKVILQGKSTHETRVEEIMTSIVFTVRPEQTIGVCMAIMTEKHIRHLPVMNGDRVVGVISIGDVVKAIISEQQFVIEQLESYISGERTHE